MSGRKVEACMCVVSIFEEPTKLGANLIKVAAGDKDLDETVVKQAGKTKRPSKASRKPLKRTCRCLGKTCGRSFMVRDSR